MDKLYGITTINKVLEWIGRKNVTPLFLCVTGSHMWNLARSDSDLDIRGVYLDPLEKVLSIHPDRDTIEAVGELGGLVDLQLYELKKTFAMLQNNNGNIVEMLLSPTTFYEDPRVDWRTFATNHLTRNLRDYYRGYFTSQRQRAMHNRGGKALVYTFREIMAGITLMRTGRVIYDFYELLNEFESTHEPSTLLHRFLDRKEWSTPVSDWQMDAFAVEWDRLCRELDETYDSSSLPKSTDDYEAMNQTLIELRIGYLRSRR